MTPEQVETPQAELTWAAVGNAAVFPEGCGTAVLVGARQIAVFHVGPRWYAVQNLCPHNRQMVLARGLVGDAGREPKVTCPLHKNSFSLADGRHLGGNQDWALTTYEVRVEEGRIKVILNYDAPWKSTSYVIGGK